MFDGIEAYDRSYAAWIEVGEEDEEDSEAVEQGKEDLEDDSVI